MSLYSRAYMRGDPERRDGPGLITVLIVANIVVFALQAIAEHWFHTPVFLEWLALSPPAILEGKVWTVVSYGFLHDTRQLLHIALNLLLLYFAGRPVLDALGRGPFLTLYFGGMVLGAAFWLAVNFRSGAPLVGASAAVSSIFAMFCFLKWNEGLMLFPIPLVLKGKVLFYVSLGITAFSLAIFEIPGNSSIGHSAHLGGYAAAAALWAFSVVGWRLPRWSWRIQLPRWWKRRKAVEAVTRTYSVNITATHDLKAEIDRILDKINAEGFGSLTADERRALDQAREVLNRR